MEKRTVPFSIFHKCNWLNKVIISDSVSSIGSNAFRDGWGIKEMTMGANISSVGGNALGNLSELKTVTYNGNIVTNTLNGFSKWTEVKLGENNTAYKVIDNIVYSADGTKIIVCPRGIAGEVIISDDVTTIESQAFERCNLITKVKLGASVTDIKARAFDTCGSLEEFEVGENVSNIGGLSFRSCSKLETVIIDSPVIVEGITAQTSWHNLVNYATTIYIKSDITTIGSYVIDNFDIDNVDETNPTYKEGYVKYVKKTS